MSKEKKRKNKKPLLYRFIFGLFRLFFKKRKLIGAENIGKQCSIIVGNHAQANGPLFAELYFPTKKAIWCIGEMMNVKEVPPYAYKDFWAHKPKCTKWFYKLLSYIIAPISAYVFTRADTIAVYKDARLLATFKNTVKALYGGANVIIFPEESTPYNEIINEFQDKFVDVAKLYYSRYKVRLSFVPMYQAPSIKTVVFGKPIVYNPDIAIDEQSVMICDYLKNEITRISKELPRHRVTPYLNIAKKKYPFSKE